MFRLIADRKEEDGKTMPGSADGGNRRTVIQIRQESFFRRIDHLRRKPAAKSKIKAHE